MREMSSCITTQIYKEVSREEYSGRAEFYAVYAARTLS
jgi:hypothetical protein